MRDDIKACPDPGCGAYLGHSPLCPLAPPEYKAKQLDHLYRKSLEGQASRGRLREKITFWQAKFHLLRRENQKLREQIKKLTTEVCALRRERNP